MVRDRFRDERGFLLRLRLWLDLLRDLASSVPREYGQTRSTLAADQLQRNSGEVLSFRVLQGEPPRPEAIFFGGLISLAAVGIFAIAIGHAGNFKPLRSFVNQPPTPAHVRPSASSSSTSPTYEDTEQGAVVNGAHLQALPLAREPNPIDASHAVVQAFDAHNIVMFGEIHGIEQEYDWLDKLVSTPEFADHVDDIVVEFGNALYQSSVDRYVAGENVPLEEVQKAWRNTMPLVGPVPPVYARFYAAVREANRKRRGKSQLRIVLGGSAGDWDKIRETNDLDPYLAQRESFYVQTVKDQVLSKRRRALLIMGTYHFLRRTGPGYIERELRASGANPYLVEFATNALSGQGVLEKRFDSWPKPALVSLAGNWVGDLPAIPVLSGGHAPATALKLSDAADAVVYVASCDVLNETFMPRSELDGTSYGKEVERRDLIETGHPVTFLRDETEAPLCVQSHPQ